MKIKLKKILKVAWVLYNLLVVSGFSLFALVVWFCIPALSNLWLNTITEGTTTGAVQAIAYGIAGLATAMGVLTALLGVIVALTYLGLMLPEPWYAKVDGYLKNKKITIEA